MDITENTEVVIESTEQEPTKKQKFIKGFKDWSVIGATLLGIGLLKAVEIRSVNKKTKKELEYWDQRLELDAEALGLRSDSNDSEEVIDATIVE